MDGNILNFEVIRNNPGPWNRISKDFRKQLYSDEKTSPGPKRKPIELSPSDQLFANLIIQNGQKSSKDRMSQTDCYRVAFQKFDLTKASCAVMATNKLKDPRVKAYIDDRKKAAARRVEIDITKVLKVLLRIVDFDVRKLFTSQGDKIPVHKLPDEVALAVSSMKFSQRTRTLPSGRKKTFFVPQEVKTESRKSAIELIGQYLSMWDGKGTDRSPDKFVNDLRQFADKITPGIPGGQV